MGLETVTYISDFNQANPDGATDLKSEGDNHLRNIKKGILNTFPNIDGEVSATQAQLNVLVGITGTAGGDDLLDALPAGTIMLFQQTAAPTGWTKETTHNDKSLRVVTGAAGAGGTDAFTTTFSAAKATEDHTLLIADMPSHNHTPGAISAGAHTHSTNAYTAGGSAGYGSIADTRGSEIVTDSDGAHTHTITAQGGDGAHAHDVTMDLQYVDIILAAKD